MQAEVTSAGCISFDSYIKPQLVVATLTMVVSCISFDSYIKPPPVLDYAHVGVGCISFDSYIKPQLIPSCSHGFQVVYLLIPTSNHNLPIHRSCLRYVVYLLIPTSNHNRAEIYEGIYPLYIF